MKPNSSERAERDRREKNAARRKEGDERFSGFEGKVNSHYLDWRM